MSLTAELEAARRDDERAFEAVVRPHRAELLAHCYRMLGSAADAEDALQETLLRAWRALPRFEGRSSLRTWLHTIATNVSLRMIERRPKRVLPIDYDPPSDPHDRAAGPLTESVWIEPFPDAALDGQAPDARYEQRESVELAFIAALQHLPDRQRAVLLLRDVLGFAPAEIAEALDASPAAVYSALQRARLAVEQRLPDRSQLATLRAIPDARLRDLVKSFVDALEASDVAAMVRMLTADATLSMPPRPSWYRGRAAIGAFLAAGPMAAARRWRAVPVRANAQPAVAIYGSCDRDETYLAHAIEVLTLDAGARITDLTVFMEPEAFARFGLPPELGP